MSTKSLIDRLQPFCGGWERTDILKLVQQGQDELFAYDAPALRYVASNNQGFPPYLKTVGATYRYDINSTNLTEAPVKIIGGVTYPVRCKRVAAIFVDVTRTEYSVRWMGAPYVYNFFNPYTNAISRISVAKVPVKSYPALETTDAYVEFIDDPTTQNDRYFCEFTWEPMRLTAENVPLCIPTEFERAIQSFVLGEIQMFSNGTLNEHQKQFEGYWKPRWHDYITGGASTSSNETDPIYC